jgi:ribonuclease HIII
MIDEREIFIVKTGVNNLSNQVIQTDQKTIDKMSQYYQEYKIDKVPQGAIFSAKIPGCTITAYKSGKVLFQGKNSEIESAKWGKQETKTPPKTKPSSSNGKYAPPENIGELSIIGSDEVGTGDYFGPVIVAAVFVERERLQLLKNIGVKDSKSLSDKQICEIAPKIIETIPHSLLILHNEKYNKMQAKGMSQGKMKALMHNQAILNVMQKIAPLVPEGILIDQFAEPTTFFKYLEGEKVIEGNIFFSTKAEGLHLSVAAASIIARFAFVKEFDKLSKKAGMTLPKGAGEQVDHAAAKLLLKLGEASLKSFAKLHFANTEKAIRLAASLSDH